MSVELEGGCLPSSAHLPHHPAPLAADPPAGRHHGAGPVRAQRAAAAAI